MTISSERTNSLLMTRKFLYALLDSKMTPRIPKITRRAAYWCLRHYPAEFDIEQVTKCKTCSKVFGKLKKDK